jgi:hypothetical protein
MRAILLRHYLSLNKIDKLGRVVMLSLPNKESEVVGKLKHLSGFILLNGPAGLHLGTDANSVPRLLGDADFDVGIITGNKSISLFLSLLIPSEDDGKVSIERAKLKGMRDFLIVPYSHPFIMKQPQVISETLHYLQKGSFSS